MKASLLLLLVVCSACAGRHSHYEKQFTQLNEKIMILQNERDRLDERIAVLEERATAPRPERQEANVLERPPLKVVRLEPRDSAEPNSSNQPAAADEQRAKPEPAGSDRTLIHGSGTAISQSPVVEAAKVEETK